MTTLRHCVSDLPHPYGGARTTTVHNTTQELKEQITWYTIYTTGVAKDAHLDFSIFGGSRCVNRVPCDLLLKFLGCIVPMAPLAERPNAKPLAKDDEPC